MSRRSSRRGVTFSAFRRMPKLKVAVFLAKPFLTDGDAPKPLQLNHYANHCIRISLESHSCFYYGVCCTTLVMGSVHLDLI